MKLTLAQLEPHLNKNLSSIYVLSGDELLLKQDARQLIQKTAKQAGFSERIRLAPDEAETLYNALYSTSLLAEKRLIDLDCTHTSPNKAAGAILQEYAEKPAENTLLMLDLAKLDDKITRSAWYKALEKAGVAIPVWPIPREQLPQWIIQRAKRYKIQLGLDAATFLTDYVEGNLSAAAQALEKVYLLQSEKPVDAALIQQVFSDESRFSVFDFVEHVLMGETARTLHVLETLRADGAEPVFIVWSIARELRLLSNLAEKLKQGERLDALLQQHAFFSADKRLFAAFYRG